LDIGIPRVLGLAPDEVFEGGGRRDLLEDYLCVAEDDAAFLKREIAPLIEGAVGFAAGLWERPILEVELELLLGECRL